MTSETKYPEELPRDSHALIDLLDALYPHCCVLPGETIESANRYAGTRELVDALIEWRRATVEGDIENPETELL